MLDEKQIIALPQEFGVSEARMIMMINMELERMGYAQGISVGTIQRWKLEGRGASASTLRRVTEAVESLRAARKAARKAARLAKLQKSQTITTK